MLANLKQNKIELFEFFTLDTSKDPYPNNDDIISSDETINANVAGILRNKLSSKDLFCKNSIFLIFFLSTYFD